MCARACACMHSAVGAAALILGACTCAHTPWRCNHTPCCNRSSFSRWIRATSTCMCTLLWPLKCKLACVASNAGGYKKYLARMHACVHTCLRACTCSGFGSITSTHACIYVVLQSAAPQWIAAPKHAAHDSLTFHLRICEYACPSASDGIMHVRTVDKHNCMFA